MKYHLGMLIQGKYHVGTSFVGVLEKLTQFRGVNFWKKCLKMS